VSWSICGKSKQKKRKLQQIRRTERREREAFTSQKNGRGKRPKKVFAEPDVTPADQIQLDWETPDVEGLVEFLVKEKGFNEERVRKGAEKLAKYLNAKQQGRLDGFFTATPNTSAPKKAVPKGKDVKGKGTKRKAEDKEEPKAGKKPKAKK